MQGKLVHEGDGQRTFVLVFDKGDEVVDGIGRFAQQQGLLAAQITAIGAFEKATLGYFDWETKDYLKIPVAEQVEVASLIGDIAAVDGKPTVHAHAVLSRRDGSAVAGHLLEGTVRPTLEVVLTEAPRHLRKRKDPETGLQLIDLSSSS